jgi:hypothetical protein
MENIGKEELLRNHQSSHKDKNGLPIEFFPSFYDFIEKDVRGLLEASRQYEGILVTFKTTFISLIQKTNNPMCYEIFFLMSICNSVYKII